MKKQERDNYIFAKKSLLLQLFLFYYSDVPYDALVLRSFGFSFDPTCNFKAIVKSHKGHIHKYVTHIFLSIPTSTTVVETRMSFSPLTKEEMILSWSSFLIRP